jgi:KAP family P-loop domain
MTDFVGHIILDAPAEKPTLRFGQIAKALATIVSSSEPRFAIGIFGGWGSGKSTLMDEIERRVRQTPGVMTVRFNAWRYEREPHLIVPLLDTIRATLAWWAGSRKVAGAQRSQVRTIAERVGRVVRALVRATSFDIGLPGAATISFDPGKAIDDMADKPDDLAASPQSLYYGAFKELSDAFSGLQQAGVSRIVVFVDDLDRCLPKQALTVLESMKLFFDMPGFIFVVGLDERVVQSAVRAKFAEQPSGETDELVEREYLKKIFQVPYTLPAVAPGQLGDLLKWLYRHGRLGDEQKTDLQDRVRHYLQHVSSDGGINPREVKRYINAYTLARMIRPDLHPDALLALQTIDFRADWDDFSENVVLAEPDLFVQALRRFHDGYDHAFEDLWPEFGVLPPDLSDFLQSPQAKVLTTVGDLQHYVSFLEQTRSAQSWVTDAMHEIGTLRRILRDLPPDARVGGDSARAAAVQLKSVLARLSSRSTDTARVARYVTKLDTLVNTLTPTDPDSVQTDVSPDWRREAGAIIDGLQQELRLIRRSTAFTP